jgi:CrcB protein
VLAAAGDGRLSDHAVALLGTGLCGGLTTFSTFGYEAVRLGEDGGTGRARATVYVVASVASGLLAFWLGWAAASVIS